MAKKKVTNKKESFFKKHKTPVIVCGSILLAGAIAGTSVGLYFALHKEQEPVTPAKDDAAVEKMIDSYLDLPNGNPVKIDDDYEIEKISREATSQLDKLNNISISALSSDNYYETLLNNTGEKEVSYTNNLNVGSKVGPGTLIEYTPNGTTEYYSGINEDKKSTNLYNTSIETTIYDNWVGTLTATDVLHNYSNGLDSYANLVSKETSFIRKVVSEQGATTYVPFLHSVFDCDGYVSPNLENNMYIGANMTTEAQATEFYNNYIKTLVQASLKLTLPGLGNEIWLQFDSNNVYRFSYQIVEDIDQSMFGLTSNYFEGYIPTYLKREGILHFQTINNKWTIVSAAFDGFPVFSGINRYDLPQYVSVYTDYDQYGNKLDTPFCVNKNKSVTLLSYGKRQTTTIADNIPLKPGSNLESPLIYEPDFVFKDSEYPEDYTAGCLNDITIMSRLQDGDFKGHRYKFVTDLCDSGFVVGDQLYLCAQYYDAGGAQTDLYISYENLDKTTDIAKEYFEEGAVITGTTNQHYVKFKKALKYNVNQLGIYLDILNDAEGQPDILHSKLTLYVY